MSIERYKELERAYNEIIFGWQELTVGSGGQKRKDGPKRIGGRCIMEEKKEYKRHHERSC